MAIAEAVVAVVPARGGSKRVPRKNVRPLAGKPLISWTLDAALQAGVFADVVVSTDDEETAQIARAAGATVPWLRPPELATDTATTVAVLQHALQWIEQMRGEIAALVLLQPTSPFRTADELRSMVEAFLRQPRDDRRVIVSVSRAASHPAWCFTIEDDALNPVLGWDIVSRRSQELPPVYALNGSIYAIPAEVLKHERPLLGPGVRPFVMHGPASCIDIDLEEDWHLAESYAARFLLG